MKVAVNKNENVTAGSLSVAGNWNTKISTTFAQNSSEETGGTVLRPAAADISLYMHTYSGPNCLYKRLAQHKKTLKNVRANRQQPTRSNYLHKIISH